VIKWSNTEAAFEKPFGIIHDGTSSVPSPYHVNSAPHFNSASGTHIALSARDLDIAAPQ
jgi:hypothetical protein